jgi:hypothetical protein
MKDILIAGLFILSLLSSCKNDKDGVREIRADGANANLIRNPASANEPLDTNQLARISYEETEYNFGTVTEGELVVHSFKFTNTGNVPLVIQKARSSCGCTIPEWPEEPIPPGGTGEIQAKFNTNAKLSEQKKIVYVTANTYPNETTVALKGFVNPRND